MGFKDTYICHKRTFFNVDFKCKNTFQKKNIQKLPNLELQYSGFSDIHEKTDHTHTHTHAHK